MTVDVWTEEAAISRTPRENILLYLYQEGPTRTREIRKELYLHDRSSDRDLRFLEDNDFVEKVIQPRSSSAEYSLSDKGDSFVKDKLLGGNPPDGM
ncbi:winged helix-turn-helix transcriptional regulator [Halostagnicola sp. A-GB9-2]|uniref:winged helix-turn-helix transcriptional regulator n=1 Tax=Halostagnicola sp. A-GB9-2 TaxID=3048066 RepID=UPI0024C07752|nr:winged helix-turn-helix transcriptional regulator [Halostagnicola sp. A-GB9-2]MDJ1433570.1 winged helix-turn-helix transcriptional regulator [Halostagnicola sp. A-GB9-2]